jgi:hypothetical protein
MVYRLLLIAAFIYSVPIADASAKMETWYSVDAPAKVYKGPGRNFPVVGTIPRREVVNRVIERRSGGQVTHNPATGKPDCKNGWCYVLSMGRLGYIPAAALVRRRSDIPTGKAACALLEEDC